MKRSMYEPRARSKGSIVVSIAAHIVLAILIGSITFHYPIVAFLTGSHAAPAAPIHYVTVAPAPRGRAGAGTNTAKPPKKAVNPAALFPPTITPTAIPPIPPPTASVGVVDGSAAGVGGAPGGSGNGAAAGVAPALHDPRIELQPKTLRLPLTMAQKNDSAVKAIFMAYREAEIEAEAHRGRDPRDWTFEHNGQKYGVDSSYIYLGKFKLPSAVLAALPINTGGVDGERRIEERGASFIQNDIYTHAQGMSEADFRAAVKRIRERKDREKKAEQAEKAKENGARTQPIVP